MDNMNDEQPGLPIPPEMVESLKPLAQGAAKRAWELLNEVEPEKAGEMDRVSFGTGFANGFLHGVMSAGASIKKITEDMEDGEDGSVHVAVNETSAGEFLRNQHNN